MHCERLADPADPEGNGVDTVAIGSPSGDSVPPDTLLPDTVRPDTLRPDTARGDSLPPKVDTLARPDTAKPVDPVTPRPDSGKASGDTAIHPAPPADPRLIHLVGHVADRSGRPLPQAVARLSGRDLADTTDAEGRYELLLLAPRPGAPAKRATAEPLDDTVVITLDDRRLASIGVGRRHDTLPVARICRRAVSGRLAAPDAGVARLTATLRAEGDTTPHAFDLSLGPDGAFAGTAWLEGSDSLGGYALHVTAHGADGRVLGLSDTLRLAGHVEDAQVPAFAARNALPSAAARVSAPLVRVGEAFTLHATATAGRSGPLSAWAWDVGGTGAFAAAGPGAFAATAPSEPRERLLCVLRVTDAAGNAALDTVALRVEDDPYRGFRALWGDVHSHSSFSSDFRPSDSALADSCRADPACAGLTGPAYLFHNAIQERLDFTVVTDHAEDLSVADWEETKAAARRFDRPGTFVPFVGYEFCDSVGTLEACNNVVFPGVEGGRVFAGRSLRRPDSGGVAEYVAGDGELWARLAVTDPGALGFVAHPPEGLSWDFPAAKRERVVGAEISSTGGGPAAREYRLCYGSFLEGLRAGNRLQVVGAGNDHDARPGRASLTAVLARDHTREAILEAFRERRTYATGGRRAFLRLDVDGHLMGSRYAAKADSAGRRAVTIRAAADLPGGIVQSLSIIRLHNGADETLLMAKGSSASLRASATDTLEAGESAIYWAEVSFPEANPDFDPEGWTSPVWVEVTGP